MQGLAKRNRVGSEKRKRRRTTKTGMIDLIEEMARPGLNTILRDLIIRNTHKRGKELRMHLWTLTRWQQYYDCNCQSRRMGVRLKSDAMVDPEVKRACREFLVWLRRQYVFPIRVPIYLKAVEKIEARDGEMVSATCFLPFDKCVEPYIRIAVGDYYAIRAKKGQDTALAAILSSIAHELTHYFQWVNDITLTLIGEERQATQYSISILDEYAQTRDRP